MEQPSELAPTAMPSALPGQVLAAQDPAGAVAPKVVAKRALMADPRGWIASGLGSGLSPWASGTTGTLAALPVCYLLGQLSWQSYALVTVALFVLGCWTAAWVIQRFGVEDPGVVVIDEWVGMLITWAPIAYAGMYLNNLKNPSWFYLLPAFLIFRLCDIAKPFPAGWVDHHLHGGFGAMLDDALAGVWGAALVSVLIFYLR